MLLQTYQLEVVNNHCMPSAQSVNCIAWLDQDVGCAIPCLNAVLEGDQLTPAPPSITFRNEGRLISVTERTITVNGVADEDQGRKIVEWIKREINEAWENRENIEPRYTKAERPHPFLALPVERPSGFHKCLRKLQWLIILTDY